MSFLIGLTGEYASVLNGYRQGSVPNREEQGFFRNETEENLLFFRQATAPFYSIVQQVRK